MSRVHRLLAIASMAMLLIAAYPIPTSSADDEIVYVTKSGKCYHREGCRSLRASKIPMRLDEAAARYAPCGICKPPRPSAAGKSEGRPARDGQSVKPDREKAPAADGRCQAKTQAGAQCKRKAKPGSDYCWQHQK
jgi:hypothetical protein